MSIKNRILTILLLVSMSLYASSNKEAKSIKEVKGKVEKTIVDQNGITVVLPPNIDRVVLTALPLASIYALTGASLDNIVGMHPGSKSAIENSIMNSMYPGLSNRETGFIQGTDINIEELLELKPDLVIYWGAYSNQTKQLEESGIPHIGVGTQGGGDALLTLSSWLEIMGEVFNKTGETKKVIDYGNKTGKQITDLLNASDNLDKPNSLFLFRHSSEDITVPGEGHYGNWWIESTGGNNVAKNIKVTAKVNMEQIYEWNPEVIFISTFTPTMPADLLENRIEGQDWSEVDAVKNGRVYKVPLGVYRWYPPSGDVPLMMKWMAQKQHPELFTYNMTNQIISYYKEFYNYELSLQDAESILNASKEASGGTKGLGAQSK